MPVGFGDSLDDETSIKELLDIILDEDIFVVEFATESEDSLAEESKPVIVSLEDVSNAELICPIDSLLELRTVEGVSLDSGDMSPCDARDSVFSCSKFSFGTIDVELDERFAESLSFAEVTVSSPQFKKKSELVKISVL